LRYILGLLQAAVAAAYNHMFCICKRIRGWKYGNTTAATIPLAMSETYRDDKLKKGDWIVLAAFSAGFTWGSLLLRWAID
jgi:predicted naringenin-chalcone synthase